MTKVSFAKIAETSDKDVPAEATEETPSSAVVPAQSTALAAQETDDDGVSTSDIKLPRLKLLQGSSDKKLLAAHGFGTLLLKDTVEVARAATEGKSALTATLVFVKLISKTYTEKPLKFGDPTKFARSLAEVEEQGGTVDWRLSRENRKTRSDKPWYQVNANCLVLVKKPETESDDHFPFEAGGAFWAPAIYTVKSFAYESFFQEIATAKATGELRKGGWASRYINVSIRIEPGKGNSEFALPEVSFGDHTPEDVQQLAAAY